MNNSSVWKSSYNGITDGMWLRGNLHAHTTRSDGAQTVDDVIKCYADENYDFLMLSDHDVFSSKEWLTDLDTRGMVLISGNEISKAGSHILHVNAGCHVQPHYQRQLVLDEIKLDEKSFAIVCHPNWGKNFDHTSISKLLEWTDYSGLEIYNGVIGCTDGSSYAADKWDMLLSNGYRCWGYANDDTHRAIDTALGWNVVYARDKSCDAIVEALRYGRFYASTGVVIENIKLEGKTAILETQNADRIAAIYDGGARYAQVDKTFIEIDLPENARYVRFECWGRGEQMAWTQPFYSMAIDT